jgi:hypothetical protein
VAQIVLVHGIAQQQWSAAKLRTMWLPNLIGGLENAERPDLAQRVDRDDFTVELAFYGREFATPDRQLDRQGGEQEAEPLSAAEEAIAFEIADELLQNAAKSPNRADAREASIQLAADDPSAEDAQGKIKAAGVRAVAALDRIPWFGRTALNIGARFKSDLAQVTRYLSDPAVREYAIGKVNALMDDDTLLVIGHSLGSVVAYDAVRARPADKPLPVFITLGSPLALSAIRAKLVPSPTDYPAAVRRWVNIAAEDDIVAAQMDLKPDYDRRRPDGAVFEDTYVVNNGSSAHGIEFYLGKPSCGKAVARALDTP